MTLYSSNLKNTFSSGLVKIADEIEENTGTGTVDM